MAEPLRYHWLPLAALEVSVTLPPEQNAVGPEAEIAGVAGGVQAGHGPGPAVSSKKPVTVPENCAQVDDWKTVLATTTKSACAGTLNEYDTLGSVDPALRPGSPR